MPSQDDQVRMRRAGPGDIPALREFFAALSGRTRYLRFFGPLWPTGAMLRRLSGTGGADAVIATAGDAVIGHAMACDEPAGRGPAATEIGVVVADGWQGRGVGAALVRELMAAAADRGVTVLAMDVLPGNRKVLDMIAGHWHVLSTEHAGDVIAVRARLPQPASERPLAGLSRPAGPASPGQPRPGGPGLRQPVLAGRAGP
ncbi:MAG: GNAT family N-acetyltransferase [Actinobacteria bacterium]|nr:GNAT family N-acetyltransferase [Actinomycetota bacterium]